MFVGLDKITIFSANNTSNTQFCVLVTISVTNNGFCPKMFTSDNT